MAVAEVWQHPKTCVDHTPAAALSAGDVVVIGNLVGVAKLDVAASALGSLGIDGAYYLAKEDSAGPVFRVGEDVYFDRVNELAVHKSAATISDVYFGTCLEAAATGAAQVLVELKQLPVPSCMQDKVWEAVDLTSASKTLDIQDVGKVFNVTGSATYVVTLPSIAAGLEYVIRAAGDGVRVAVDPAAADKIMGADIAGVDNKDRILTAATAKEGDYLHLAYGSADGWMILAMKGIWAAEA